MKKKFIIPLVILCAFYGILYVWNKEGNSIKLHPAIHSTAIKPDDYLLEAKDYEDMQRHDKSAYSLEQAIQAIWKLEKDVDGKGFDRLEQTIDKLEKAHRKIIQDSVSSGEFLSTLEYALGNLAIAELEVAENYSAANQTDEARSALRYAQLHIKNALILQDSVLLSSEELLLHHMDSLLGQKNLSQPEYIASLDQLIKEVDDVIRKIEER